MCSSHRRNLRIHFLTLGSCLASCLHWACEPPSGADLYGGPPSNEGSPGPSAAGGASGTPPVAGGVENTPPGSGAASGSPSRGGQAGFTPIADAAAPAPDVMSNVDASVDNQKPDGPVLRDASTPSRTCPLEGSWATFVHVPVTWPQAPFVLLGGEGELRQWTLSTRTYLGDGRYRDEVLPCGISLPDLQGELFAGYEKFGIRFPDSLFDDGEIPPAEFTMDVEERPDGSAGFETSTFAMLLGHRMQDPTTALWPAAASSIVSEDHDLDGNPGITVLALTGGGYGYPPVQLPFTSIEFARAERIYLATRTVTELSGTVENCDHMSGSVQVLSIGGTAAINSRLIGCRRSDGVECTEDEAAFVDANRPQFTPSGLGEMDSMRMTDGATCARVRALYPG